MSQSKLPPQLDPIDHETIEPTVSLLKTDTLADSVMIFLVLAVVQRAVGFLRAILFCRWLPPEELGQWDIAFNFLFLAVPLAMLAVPSCLGRYLAYYEKRGHQYTFIRRTARATMALALSSALIMIFARSWLSQLIFGMPDQTELVVIIAIAVAVVAPSFYVIELLTALKTVRLVAIMQMLTSFSFAGFGLLFLAWFGYQAKNILLGYIVAAFLGTLLGLWMTRYYWRGWNIPSEPLQLGPFWAKIMPYVIWVTLASFLSNLFLLSDRYMIIHYSGVSPDAALSMVGQYHSGRVLPDLIITLAQALAAMALPHLSVDWESGNIKVVQDRTRLAMKLIGFFTALAGAICVLIAPLLFNSVLEGKFQDGLAVMPLVTAYAVFWSLILIASNYLLCAEKARLSSIAIGTGLVLNIVLNLILLPRFGLFGAVGATATSNLVVLLIIVGINRGLGCRLDRTLIVLLFLPTLFYFGPVPVLVVLVILAVATLFFRRCLTSNERALLDETWDRYKQKFSRIRKKR
jgi:O-antigen/teichoic acid export membrane protein